MDGRVALNTGLIAGLLIEAHQSGLYRLVAVPRVDRGGFTNVIDLVDDGVPVMTVTVDLIPRDEP